MPAIKDAGNSISILDTVLVFHILIPIVGLQSICVHYRFMGTISNLLLSCTYIYIYCSAATFVLYHHCTALIILYTSITFSSSAPLELPGTKYYAPYWLKGLHLYNYIIQ